MNSENRKSILRKKSANATPSSVPSEERSRLSFSGQTRGRRPPPLTLPDHDDIDDTQASIITPLNDRNLLEETSEKDGTKRDSQKSEKEKHLSTGSVIEDLKENNKNILITNLEAHQIVEREITSLISQKINRIASRLFPKDATGYEFCSTFIRKNFYHAGLINAFASRQLENIDEIRKVRIEGSKHNCVFRLPKSTSKPKSIDNPMHIEIHEDDTNPDLLFFCWQTHSKMAKVSVDKSYIDEIVGALPQPGTFSNDEYLIDKIKTLTHCDVALTGLDQANAQLDQWLTKISLPDLVQYWRDNVKNYYSEKQTFHVKFFEKYLLAMTLKCENLTDASIDCLKDAYCSITGTSDGNVSKLHKDFSTKLDIIKKCSLQHYQPNSFAALLFENYMATNPENFIVFNLEPKIMEDKDATMETEKAAIDVFSDYISQLHRTFATRLQIIINTLAAKTPLWQFWYIFWHHRHELLAQPNPNELTITIYTELLERSNQNEGQNGVVIAKQLLSELSGKLPSFFFKTDPATGDKVFKTREDLALDLHKSWPTISFRGVQPSIKQQKITEILQFFSPNNQQQRYHSNIEPQQGITNPIFIKKSK